MDWISLMFGIAFWAIALSFFLLGGDSTATRDTGTLIGFMSLCTGAILVVGGLKGGK